MLSLRPVVVKTRNSEFDLVGLVDDAVGRSLRGGDVLVISSKFVAMAEGRVAQLRAVKPGEKAKELAVRYGMDPRLCELVIRVADELIGGIPGFLLATKDGLLTPNA